jgi:3-oxoacyl-[acyl-carrier-protein] synthase II
MMQPLYIRAACTISPQHTYHVEQFLLPLIGYDGGKLFVVDTDYTRFISPVAIRRMSPLLKRSITAGMQCLADAGVTTPDAIITGTARGSVTDMERFVKDMIANGEEALNPTYFIQSTYNSVNGWLAMQTRATGYNQTFVHRGASLEMALIDAALLLQESAHTADVLVGGYEELTEEYFIIRSKAGYYKRGAPNSLELFEHTDTPGSIAGEGSSFFSVTNEKNEAICAIIDVRFMVAPTPQSIASAIGEMLAANDLTAPDLLISGMNGDSRTHSLSMAVHVLLAECGICTFKHLCGEYDTASGFALWLAHHIFTSGMIPEATIFRKRPTEAIRTILIYNVTILGNVSLMMLQRG